MGNKFSANILLCEEITDDKRFEGIFNNLILEEDEIVIFNIAIFLTKNIVEVKDEMFLLDLAYERENGTNYHPIGTTTRMCNELGKSIEIAAFKSVEVEFAWEGLYRLEFRKCKNHVDINTLNDEELLKFIKNSDLVQSFTFSVEKNVRE